VEKDLGEILLKAGQKDGEAWCCYFAEAIFCEAYPQSEVSLRKLFSASCVQTFKNFTAKGFSTGMIPKPNALMIMQNYKDGAPLMTGHAGIVDSVNQDGTWYSIEGNTNDGGSREGDSVQLKHRANIRKLKGLNLLGFVYV